MLAIFSAKKWPINSLDIKSAFLQGNGINRDIFLTLPKESGTCNIWKLNTTVYGLLDASRIWYLRVKKELQQLGVNTSKYDEATYSFGDMIMIYMVSCVIM